MASFFLTLQSSMSCPHGGTITASTTNTRVKADQSFVLRSNDTFTIGGCPYMLGVVPHPCAYVQWDVPAQRHTSQRDPSLTRDSVGLCLAADGAVQGVVVIGGTQQRAQGT